MLKLGLPSKGRLMEKTFDWFGERGVVLRRTGSEREYAASVEGLGGLSLVLSVLSGLLKKSRGCILIMVWYRFAS